LPSAEASASSPHEPLTRPEPGGAEKITPHDRPHEGAGEWTELVVWLKKCVGIDDNHEFQPSERAEIMHEIKKLHVEVRKLTELNLEQQKALDQSLEELQSGSERMRKKDWLIYAIGLGTSLIIAEIVPPLVVLPFAVHAFHALGRIFIPNTPASP
jgi:hypothetical protein